MATATVTETRPATTKAVWTGRVISTLLAAFMLFDGVVKLFKPAFVVEATVKLGISESAIVGIGAACTVAALLYAIPATAALGAILLTGYLGGAVMAHVHTGDPAWMVYFPVVFGVLVWLGLFLRDPRVRGLIPIRR
jgi:hypothetical protein